MSVIEDDEDELNDYLEKQKEEEMEHPVLTAQTKIPHVNEMIMNGYTDAQILQLHPEITQADIDSAKQQLLNSNN